MLETGSDSFYLVEINNGNGRWWDASYDGFAEFLPPSHKPSIYHNRLRYDDITKGKEAVYILNNRLFPSPFKFRLSRINMIVLRTEVV